MQADARTFVQVGFPGEMLERLDSYRRAQSNPPTRASAVRDLARAALCQGAKADARTNECAA
jgi:metal-responsive CopG/Arc/MetJ family transcriptional regulator